jgi:hypothetical protein
MNTKQVFSTLVFLILTVFSYTTVQSQAKVENDFTVVFTDDSGAEYEANRARKTISASGMIVISASFSLPDDHYLVPDKGTWPTLIEVQLLTSNDKRELVFMSDEKVDIPSNGKFNVSLHLNGSGNALPWGWYTPNEEEE